MSKRRKLLIALACAVAASVLAVLLARDREPSYQGKPLSAWMAAYQDAKTSEEAEASKAAVRAIGTNALPVLVHWIGYSPSSLDKRLRDLNQRAPGVMGTHWVHWNIRRSWGFLGIWILGTNATPALPEMRAVLKAEGEDAFFAARAAGYSISFITNSVPQPLLAGVPTTHPDCGRRPDFTNSPPELPAFEFRF